MTDIMKIGTRGSPLALAQAYETRDRLQAAHPGLQVEIVEIKTTGDKIQDRPLSEVGGKGLFTKELDEAQLDGRVQIAVHSMKDLETRLPDGICLAAVLPREDVRDAFISNRASSLAELPEGAVVGTSSLRRQALVKIRRPDLQVVTFRGNVQTRLRKLADGVADATLLAMAGLNRLGYHDVITSPLETDDMLPAVAQGAIAITCREDDDATRALLAPLDHSETAVRVSAERAMLRVLDGSCRTPIAGLAELDANGGLKLRGLVAHPEGLRSVSTEVNGDAADAVALGEDAGRRLQQQMGEGFLE